MNPKTVLRCLALLAVLAASFARSAPASSCAPCRRAQCQQICGPQRPAFCGTDEITGCPVCMCNG